MLWLHSSGLENSIYVVRADAVFLNARCKEYMGKVLNFGTECTFRASFPKIRSNIILSSVPKSSTRFIPIRFSDLNFMCISYLSYTFYIPRVCKRPVCRCLFAFLTVWCCSLTFRYESNSLTGYLLKLNYCNNDVTLIKRMIDDMEELKRAVACFKTYINHRGVF